MSLLNCNELDTIPLVTTLLSLEWSASVNTFELVAASTAVLTCVEEETILLGNCCDEEIIPLGNCLEDEIIPPGMFDNAV